jgi:heptaprenyl diphosphate synthase
MSVRKMTLLSMMLALAVALGWVESLIPSFWIPGAKPGFANMVILLCLLEFGFWDALLINLGRVLLVGAVTGTIFQMGFYMSAAGAALSMIVMWVCIRFLKKLTIYGDSLLGALAHDLGQLLVGWGILGNAGVFYYFPYMALVSLATGFFVAFVVDRLERTGIIKKALKGAASQSS